MNYHVVSTSNAGYGAIFTNNTEAKAYQNDHPGSVYRLFDHLPDRIPPRSLLTSMEPLDLSAQDSFPVDLPMGVDLDIADPRLTGPLTVYIDGSCLGNPGPGGYGVIIEDANRAVHELCQGYTYTTNQRMELMGIIAALEVLPKDQSITIVSDSKYAIDGLNKGWAVGWRANGWKTSGGKPAANPDLWERLLNLVEQFNDRIRFKWVKGHAGNPLNEKADDLATGASRGEHLISDEGYNSPGYRGKDW